MTADINQRAEAERRRIDEEKRHKAQRDARSHIEYVGPEICSVEPPKTNEIIPGILPCASTIFCGAGHEGKSAALLWLASRIALGLKAFGRECRQGKVLYVFGEDSSNDVRRLIHLLLRQDWTAGNMAKTLNENLLLLNAATYPNTPALVFEANGSWYPGSWFDAIELIIDAQDYSAVICDTLSSLSLPEAALNDSAAAYNKGANRMAEKHRLAFIGSHHLSQEVANNRRIGMYAARGATALVDNARAVIQIQKHSDGDAFVAPQNADGAYLARLHVVKHKWSALSLESPLWLSSNSYNITDFDAITGAELVEARRLGQQRQLDNKLKADQEHIFDVIDQCQRKNIQPTKAAIQQFCDGVIGVNRVPKVLDWMVEAELIKVGEGKRTGTRGPAPAIFRLPQFGEV